MTAEQKNNSSRDDRKKRLAAALRANLKRRKAQSRKRAGQERSPDEQQ